MKPEYLSLLAGFVGAIIGATASVVIIMVQQYFQTKRERARLALDAGIKQFTADNEYARFMVEQGRPVETRDLFYHVLMQSRLFPLIHKKTLSADRLRTMYGETLALSEHIDAYIREKKKEKAQQGAEWSTLGIYTATSQKPVKPESDLFRIGRLKKH